MPPQPLEVAQPRVIPESERGLWAAMKGPFPEIYIGRLDGAEVFGREFAVLSADGCLFLEGFVTSPDVFPRKGGPVKFASSDSRVLLDLPREPMVADGPCIVLGRPNNHFHFLPECLPRIWCLEQYGVSSDVPALVPAELYPTSLELLPPLAVRFLRERLLPRAPADADSPARVYLSRTAT